MMANPRRLSIQEAQFECFSLKMQHTYLTGEKFVYYIERLIQLVQ